MKQALTGTFTVLLILASTGCVQNMKTSITAKAVGITDLTGDGLYTVSDAVYLARIINGNADYSNSFTDLDITGDYIVDQIDLRAYLRYLAGY